MGALALSLLLVAFFSGLDVAAFASSWMTKDQIINDMKALCDSSSIASYESIGKTVSGNDIWLFRIGGNSQTKFLVDGATHGMETPGSHNIYLLLRWLLGGSAEANNVLSRIQVLLVPIVNYDRFAKNDSVGDSRWRDNANGVDLNRNHARGWNQSDPYSIYYSGPAPNSEPETRALDAIYTAELPKVYVTIHDFGGSESTNGDFRPPNYGGASYTADRVTLLNAYRAKVQSMYGLTGHITYATSAYGGSVDDGYNDGLTLSFCWEETRSWGTNPETINYELIQNNKSLHLRAFTMAVADLYGQASNSIQTLPTGSILINDGYTVTDSISVTLTLTTNDLDGAIKMRFSNDNSTWTSWEPFSTTKLWNLDPDDGTKTVYFQIKNNAGLISSTYLANITLIPDLPEFPSLTILFLFVIAMTIILALKRKHYH